MEVNEASEIVAEAADQEANIIFGAVIDDSLKDDLRVTVIATGFDQRTSFIKKPKTHQEGSGKQVERENPFKDHVDIPNFLKYKR
jgi:cell division protein FtsZ